MVDTSRRLLLAACTFAPWVARGDGPPAADAASSRAIVEPIANQHYRVLDGASAKRANRIEVLEFFSFGCPHCHRFQPVIDAWLKTRADDVDFAKISISLGQAQWIGYSRLYVALNRLNRRDLIADVFDAIHRRRGDFANAAWLSAWCKGHGLDTERLVVLMNSEGVNQQVSFAEELARQLKVDGIPGVVIGRRFVTSPVMAGTYRNTLRVMDDLVARVRAIPIAG